MLRLIDHSFASPEHNLALDELLLEEVEQGCADALRFWESPARFVVLGTSQKVAEEVREDACAADGVPILRRCTAGGCVLQGPGSLNYTLALQYKNHPETATLHGSYCYILNRIAEAFTAAGFPARARGACDLASGDLKISGNAQRRKRNAFLHHGTLLYQPDTEGMERYLREPKDRPEYRGPRRHADFVTALPFEPEALKRMVQNAFDPGAASVPITEVQVVRTEELADKKYRDPAWTYRR